MLIAGCIGNIGDTPDEGDRQTQGDPCTSMAADDKPLYLLSRVEYNNAIADLFGDTSRPMTITPGTGNGRFDNNAESLRPSLRDVEEYLSLADGIAGRAVEAGLVPCEDGPDARSCFEAFLLDFGRRLFRRPLSEERLASVMSLYDELRGHGDFASAVEGVLAAMLQMPEFLYHLEGVGRGPGNVQLDGYEMAARLSFFLWETTPDDALLDAAETGELDSAEGVRRQAEQMLDDDRARAMVARFYEQLLGLSELDNIVRDPELFGELTPELREAMQNETLAFVERVVLDEGGSSGDLYAAQSHQPVDGEPLASFYGVDGDRRGGLLTQASFLALQSHYEQRYPYGRARFILDSVICQPLGEPPPDASAVDASLPDPPPDATLREELEAKHLGPGCGACHQHLIPLGMAFEHYDAVGRWRDHDERGEPVDASGTFSLASEPVHFEDALELSAWIAEAEETERCGAGQWFERALARPAEQPIDQCVLDGLAEEGPLPIRRIIVELVASDLFRFRINETVEECR